MFVFYPGFQYSPPQYPPYYKMAPVYSWYQRDENPAPEVVMEPSNQGESLEHTRTVWVVLVG